MNLPLPVVQPTYSLINCHILEATENAWKECMQQFVLEEMQETDAAPSINTIISGDGTWIMRGHNPFIGLWEDIGHSHIGLYSAIYSAILLYGT